MKKESYVSPALRVFSPKYSASLLTASPGTDYSSSSSLEDFVDNGDSIVW